MDSLQLSGLLALAGFALAGAFGDIRTRMIPNVLCGVAVVTGLALVFAMGGSSALLASTLHVLASLVGGMALFGMKAIGGGDAKFYAALAAWFPLSSGLYYLFSVSLAGIVLLLMWFLASKLVLRTRPGLPLDNPFRKLPYGVAIGTGATAAYLMSLGAR